MPRPVPPNPVTPPTTNVPPVMLTPPVPRAPAAAALRTPPDTVTPPVMALLPDRTRVPGPALVSPWVPASGVATVAVMAELLTAIDGPPALLSVSVLVPRIDQPNALEGLSNTRLPIVRGVSTV